MILRGMLDLCGIIFETIFDLLRPRAALEAEIFVLRQQIVVLRRGNPGRVPFSVVDRMVLGWVCQRFRKPAKRASDRSARHCSSVASRKFPALLALEVEASSGPSRGAD